MLPSVSYKTLYKIHEDANDIATYSAVQIIGEVRRPVLLKAWKSGDTSSQHSAAKRVPQVGELVGGGEDEDVYSSVRTHISWLFRREKGVLRDLVKVAGVPIMVPVQDDCDETDVTNLALTDKDFMLVMHHFPGRKLSFHFASRVDVALILSIFIEAATVLAKMHSSGYIHNNLDSDCILVGTKEDVEDDLNIITSTLYKDTSDDGGTKKPSLSLSSSNRLSGSRNSNHNNNKNKNNSASRKREKGILSFADEHEHLLGRRGSEEETKRGRTQSMFTNSPSGKTKEGDRDIATSTVTKRAATTTTSSSSLSSSSSSSSSLSILSSSSSSALSSSSQWRPELDHRKSYQIPLPFKLVMSDGSDIPKLGTTDTNTLNTRETEESSEREREGSDIGRCASHERDVDNSPNSTKPAPSSVTVHLLNFAYAIDSTTCGSGRIFSGLHPLTSSSSTYSYIPSRAVTVFDAPEKRVLQGSSQLTSNGNPSYIPDCRSDLYSLGVALLHSLTGGQVSLMSLLSSQGQASRGQREEGTDSVPSNEKKDLLRDEFDHHLIQQIFERANLPRVLQHIVLKMIAFKPSQRYQSAVELREDLSQVRSHSPLLFFFVLHMSFFCIFCVRSCYLLCSFLTLFIFCFSMRSVSPRGRTLPTSSWVCVVV